jgi:two-component system cell cycle sensor histidine kinase/response regulator CckA
MDPESSPPLEKELERLRWENEQLKEQLDERRWQKLFELNSSVQWLVDTETGQIIEANPAAARFYGYSVAQLKRMNVWDINTLSREKVEAEIQNAVSQRRNYFIFPHRLASGEMRMVEVHSSPIPYGGRTVLHSIIHDITEHYRMQDALQVVSESTAHLTRDHLFREIVRSLSRNLGMRSAYIGLLARDTPTMIRTIAFWSGEHFIDNIEYDTRGTPCEHVVGKVPCVYAQGVQEIFPDDIFLKSLHAECYIGLPLFDSADHPLGLLAIMDDKPAKSTDLMIRVLNIFALRIGSELERLRMEDTLRESEARLRHVIENMPIMMNAFDEQGLIVAWNKECEAVTGYDAAEILHNPHAIEMLYPDSEYRERKMAEWQVRGNDYRSWEWELTCKDGTKRTIAWSNVSGNLPIPGWSSWGIGVDVTERKELERHLQQQADLLQAIGEHAPVLLTFADLGTGKPVWMSKEVERVLGYSLEELKRPDIMEHFYPDPVYRQGIMEFFLQAAREWREVTMHAKDGREIQITWINIRVLETMIVSIGIDVTERKQLQEQLFQSQKMESIGRLAGGVAHDFNNLLTAIIGYTELTLDLSDLSETAQLYLANVLKASERAANLTQQLLAFARKHVSAATIINLHGVVVETDQLLRRLIGEDIELVTILPEGVWNVKADTGQMVQVLINLAVNARDAMPDGGKLTIELANATLDEGYIRFHHEVIPGEYVMLAVSDTGMGMTSEVKAHIFEPFFTTKTEGRGTGLGLATSYGIIRQAGGHIWVYSEPGQGTTFKIYLPRALAEVAIPTSISETITSLIGTETVLVVEDEPQVRLIATEILRANGYKVLEAYNGEEALRVVENYSEAIDLLLTDVVMPQMGGVELANHLQEIRPDIKVLYVSGYTENTVVHHGVLDESVSFLAKPYTPMALAKKTREVLDS